LELALHAGTGHMGFTQMPGPYGSFSGFGWLAGAR